MTIWRGGRGTWLRSPAASPRALARRAGAVAAQCALVGPGPDRGPRDCPMAAAMGRLRGVRVRDAGEAGGRAGRRGIRRAPVERAAHDGAGPRGRPAAGPAAAAAD